MTCDGKVLVVSASELWAMSGKAHARTRTAAQKLYYGLDKSLVTYWLAMERDTWLAMAGIEGQA